MRIYEFTEYRDFIRAALKSSGGRGQISRLSHSLRLSPAQVSQVLSGGRQFNLDQALSIATFLGLSESECDYFLVLVQRDQASSKPLRERLDHQLEKLRRRAESVRGRLSSPASQPPQEASHEFYSIWFYTAIETLVQIEKYRTPTAIAKAFQLPSRTVIEALRFLASAGFCVEKEGSYFRTKKNYFTEGKVLLPFMMNWRIKAIENTGRKRPDDLHYSSLNALGEKEKKQIQGILQEAGRNVMDKGFDASHPTELFCTNIDFFQVSAPS